MKKLLFSSLVVIALGFGLGLNSNHSHSMFVLAEDAESVESVESIETESELESYLDSESDSETESIVESESAIESDSEGIYDTISQTAKDIIEVIKSVLNQPIVIGGVSITLGTIVVWVFSKLFSALSKKKINDLLAQLQELGTKVDESVKKKDLTALQANFSELYQVCELLVDNTKNVNVKAKAQALLKELEPVKDELVDYGKKESEMVVEDTKEQLDKSAKEVVDIINKE